MKTKKAVPEVKIDTLDLKIRKSLFYFFPVFLIIYWGFFSNHVIIYQSQLKLFFFDTYYLSQYFDKPGGLLDFCSSFLLQFYHYFWAGVIISTLLNLTFFILLRKINKILFDGLQTDYMSFLITIFLFGLQNSYGFIPVYSLGFIIVVCFFYCYLKISKKKYFLSVIFGLAGIILLYFAAAGYVWILAGMISTSEIINRTSYKKFFLPVFLLSSSLLVCYLSYKYLYIISPKNIWFLMLPFNLDYQWKFLPWLLIIGLVLLPVIPLFKTSKLKGLLNRRFIAQSMILVVLMLIIGLTFHGKAKIQFLSRFYALNDESVKVIELVEKSQSSNMLVNFSTNLSLCKDGTLLDNMFNYFQGFGINGLMLYTDKKPLSDLLKSKLNYELGYINEAHHWAFESLVQSGETKDALLLLVKTNIINGHFDIARKYLDLMEKSLFNKDTALSLRKYLYDEPLIQKNKEFASKRLLMPTVDQFADNLEERNLEFLLKNHPENRTAFEYLAACRLLKIQVPYIANHIIEFKNASYNILPKSIQEAFILYWASTGKKPDLAGFQLNGNYISSFTDYAKLVGSFKDSNNKEEKYEEIKSKFENTYWFYVDFTANQNQN